MQVDVTNVQGLVTTLYRRPLSRHLLCELKTAEGGRAFITQLAPHVTNGLPPEAGSVLFNIGLTFKGVSTLRPEWPLNAFETAFIEGPQPTVMGDWVNTKSEERGWWEQQFSTDRIGCILHIHADTPEQVEAMTATVRQRAADCDVRELIPRRDGTVLDGRRLGGRRLHFGYVDGISKLAVAWDDSAISEGDIHYRHFVLGYHTEAVQSFPNREPLVSVLRDSSYAVFRWIYQDVAAFNRYLAQAAASAYPANDPSFGQEYVAAKLMGRWRTGEALALAPDHPDPGVSVDDFGYADDPRGHRCPVTAHIRVVNPRDQALDAVAAIEGVPRVLRRGMPYGPPLEGTEDDGIDRGILGIFICSNIGRQFYTLMRWISRTAFSPVFADVRGQDAIAGNRGIPNASRRFVAAGSQNDVGFPPLLDFIHTKGTVFALVPSITALRAIARN